MDFESNNVCLFTFLVLEVHYDNPRKIAGMVDNSGMEFFYTNEAAENRTGLLMLG